MVSIQIKLLFFLLIPDHRMSTYSRRTHGPRVPRREGFGGAGQAPVQQGSGIGRACLVTE